MTQCPKIGFAMLVKNRGKAKEANAHADSVILLYLDTCLIM